MKPSREDIQTMFRKKTRQYILKNTYCDFFFLIYRPTDWMSQNIHVYIKARNQKEMSEYESNSAAGKSQCKFGRVTLAAAADSRSKGSAYDRPKLMPWFNDINWRRQSSRPNWWNKLWKWESLPNATDVLSVLISRAPLGLRLNTSLGLWPPSACHDCLALSQP